MDNLTPAVTNIPARRGYTIAVTMAAKLRCADIVNLGKGPAVVTAVSIEYPVIKVCTTKGWDRLDYFTSLLVMRAK